MDYIDYTIRFIGNDDFAIQMQGTWQDALETAKYHAQYCKVISFYDRNETEILTMTSEQLLNEMLTIIHEQ